MQQLLIAGTIGRDAELRQAGENQVCGFSVVVDNGKDQNGQKRDGTWFDASLWGKRGEALCRFLVKGTKVTITGRPTARAGTDGKVYQGVSVNEITLQGGGQQNASTAAPAPSHQAPAPSDDLDSSDIPF